MICSILPKPLTKMSVFHIEWAYNNDDFCKPQVENPLKK